MELRQLRYFKVLCEEKNFTRAAKRLFITQQGLSRSIQLLEDELHTVLIVRNTTPLSITKAGQYLLRRCTIILSEIDETVDYFNDTGEEGAKITVAYNGNAYFMLPDKINASFMEANPDIKFKLCDLPELECEQRLCNDLVDVAISANPIDHSKFEVYFLMEGQMHVLVKKDHPLAFYSEVTLENICKYDVTTIDSRYKGYHIFRGACRDKGVAPRSLTVATSTVTMLQLCRANDSVGISYKHFEQILNMKDMCYVPIKKSDMSYKVYMVLKKGRAKTDAMVKYCNHVINTVKKSKNEGNIEQTKAPD
mgnify:FL=1